MGPTVSGSLKRECDQARWLRQIESAVLKGVASEVAVGTRSGSAERFEPAGLAVEDFDDVLARHLEDPHLAKRLNNN